MTNNITNNMMKMNAQLQQAADELVALSGKPACGHLVFQLVPAGVTMDHGVLEAECDSAGVPKRWRPKEVRQRTAAKRAMADLSRRLGKGYEARRVNVTTEDEEVFEIVEVLSDEDAKKNIYDRKETLVLNLMTGLVTSSGYDSNWAPHEVAAAALYRKYRAHNATDLRNMVLGFLRRHGVMLSTGSGVYFVPQSQSVLDVLGAMQSALATGGGTVITLAQPDTAATRASMEASARTSLSGELAQLEQRLGAIDVHTLGDKTFGKKMVELSELKAKAAVLAGVLQFKADDINAKVDAVAQAFNAKVKGLLNVPTAPAAALAVNAAPAPAPAPAFDLVSDLAMPEALPEAAPVPAPAQRLSTDEEEFGF